MRDRNEEKSKTEIKRQKQKRFFFSMERIKVVLFLSFHSLLQERSRRETGKNAKITGRNRVNVLGVHGNTPSSSDVACKSYSTLSWTSSRIHKLLQIHRQHSKDRSTQRNLTDDCRFIFSFSPVTGRHHTFPSF